MKMISIQKKIIKKGFFVTLILSTLLYLILNFFISSNITKLEDSAVRKNILRATNGLEDYLQYLFQKSGDWAKWDASYDFLIQGSAGESIDYVKENLNVESLSVLDINMVIYLDSEGEVFFQQGFDSNTQELYKVSSSALKEITLVKELLNKSPKLESIRGYLSLEGEKQPLLFVAHKVLKSDGSGPSPGTLIMGRYLDDKINKILFNYTLYPVYIQPFEDDAMPSNLMTAKLNLLNGEPDYIYHAKDNNYGYALYLDVWGEPAFIVRINVPRELIKNYLAATHYSLYSVFAGGMLLSFMAYFLIRKYALKPLRNLHQGVYGISRGDADYSKFNVQGNDEISFLSQEIGKMLENINITENDLEKKNLELKKINSFMIGRELKMIDLKEEIKKLKKSNNNLD